LSESTSVDVCDGAGERQRARADASDRDAVTVTDRIERRKRAAGGREGHGHRLGTGIHVAEGGVANLDRLILEREDRLRAGVDHDRRRVVDLDPVLKEQIPAAGVLELGEIARRD
jgi:hypothetical protein